MHDAPRPAGGMPGRRTPTPLPQTPTEVSFLGRQGALTPLEVPFLGRQGALTPLEVPFLGRQGALTPLEEALKGFDDRLKPTEGVIDAAQHPRRGHEVALATLP